MSSFSAGFNGIDFAAGRYKSSDSIAELSALLGNLQMQNVQPHKQQYACAKAHFDTLGMEILPALPCRPQDRVYVAVVRALESLGRKETVESIHTLIENHLFSLPEDHHIRKCLGAQFAAFANEIVTERIDEEIDFDRARNTGIHPKIAAAARLELLAEALDMNIQFRFLELISEEFKMRRQLTIQEGERPAKQSITVLEIDGEFMPVVAKAARAAQAVHPATAAKPLLNFSDAARYQDIRARFISCRTDAARKAYLDQVQREERARDIGKLVTHADWKAYAQKVTGSILFRVHGEVRCISANYNALQTAHYYIAKLSNGSNPHECVKALLHIFAYRMTKGETEEALLASFNQVVAAVPRETHKRVLETLRAFAADRAQGMRGFSDAEWKLASRMSVMGLSELQDSVDSITPIATFVLEHILQQFGMSATEEDCKYHIMALMWVLASRRADHGVVDDVVRPLSFMKGLRPAVVDTFTNALGKVWVQLMENEQMAIAQFAQRVTSDAAKRAEIVQLLAGFKPAEFAGKLVEVVSVDAVK